MPLLGSAAMLLSFDIVKEAVAQHDDWHTHEHLAERLSIPGFLRATRWTALQSPSTYLVLYEVESLDTLASEAYLERLNHPTPWTQKIMPHFRGMKRGLCSVVGSQGLGMGHFGLLVRFKPAPDKDAALTRWLVGQVLPGLPNRVGLGSAHLLKSALAPQMTNEQRIRGSDAGMDWALLVTGYNEDALAALVQGDLSSARLEVQGATAIVISGYRTDYVLTAGEMGA